MNKENKCLIELSVVGHFFLRCLGRLIEKLDCHEGVALAKPHVQFGTMVQRLYCYCQLHMSVTCV